MRNLLTIIVGIICFSLLQGTTVSASDNSFIEVTLGKGVPSANGAFFAGSNKHVIIMVPGAKYDKESWYFLAKHFQKIGISSLALDSGSYLEEAIGFVRQKGFKQISSIGGSAGGESLINAINSSAKGAFRRMVVLAPYDGKPIEDEKLQKLFVIGKKDFVVDYYDVVYLHKKSAEPKKLHVYKKSSAHAQELFETDLRDDLINLITDFVK